ncbi:MAG TPA: shikimate kinase [Sphaerochaeta sp.]|nr:shikimate kinase [Sphaerochaeta sp.]
MAIIFFCGIKHSGKTSLGTLVAKRMHYRCVDNDDLILLDRPEFPSIRQLYKAEGKEAFMAQEAASLKSFLAMNPEDTIISLGGGACDNGPLVSLIHASGVAVYLKVEQSILLKRILAGGVPPFLDPLNIEGSFAELYAHRDELYGKLSDIVIELSPYAGLNDTAHYLFSRLSEELLHGSQ